MPLVAHYRSGSGGRGAGDRSGSGRQYLVRRGRRQRGWPDNPDRLHQPPHHSDGDHKAIPHTDGLSGPRGITLGPDGAIWFTEHAKVKLGRISSDGSIVEYAYPHAGAHPENIVAGPDGNLWFSQGGPAAGIARITPSGDIAQFPVSGAATDPTGPSDVVAAGPDKIQRHFGVPAAEHLTSRDRVQGALLRRTRS